MQEGKQLDYTDDFKDFVRENPGVLKTFFDIEREIEEYVNNSGLDDEDAGRVFEKNGMRVVLLNDRGSDSYEGFDENSAMYGAHFRVEIGDRSFFVKTMNGLTTFGGEFYGHDEFQSAKELGVLLADIEGVQVVSYQLGYQDKETERTYFVSGWVNNATLLEEYEPNNDTESDEIDNRVKNIETKLGEKFTDIGRHNMLYALNKDNGQPESQDFTIYVFDTPNIKHKGTHLV